MSEKTNADATDQASNKTDQTGANEADTEKKSFDEKYVNDTVSKAFSKRLSPLQEEIKSLKGMIEELKTANAPPKKSDKSDESDVKKLEEHPSFKQVVNELSKFKASAAKSRETLASSTLRSALLKAGAANDAVEPLMSHLKQRIAFESDDSDNLVFRVNDSDTSLEEGIKDFFKTDPSAKFFLAANGSKGSGDTGGYNSNNKTQNSELDGWRKLIK